MQRTLIVAVAITLAGCGARPDDSICTPIFDAVTPTDTQDSMRLQRDPDWQMKRADACVHRQAYRLAHSTDPAETVAKATVEACEAVISTSASINAAHEVDQGYVGVGEVTFRIDSIKAAYERMALLKVVEGRAGKCRA